MNLRNYNLRGERQQGQEGGQAETRDQFAREERGTTWFDQYRPPMRGTVNVGGQNVDVLILQPGDQPGSSDVQKCIDREGNIRTVKEEHVRVTAIPSVGGAYIPLDVALAQTSFERAQ